MLQTMFRTHGVEDEEAEEGEDDAVGVEDGEEEAVVKRRWIRTKCLHNFSDSFLSEFSLLAHYWRCCVFIHPPFCRIS